MSENLTEIDLHLKNPNDALQLFGANDKHLKLLETLLNVSIVSRGEIVSVSGDTQAISLVQDILITLLNVIKKGITISERDIVYAVDLAKEGKINQLETLFEDEITKNAKGKSIRIKTLGQKKYIQAIKSNDLVFGIVQPGLEKHTLLL